MDVVAQTLLPRRPYESISFVDVHPDWYKTFFDSTTISLDTMDGYNIMIKPTDIPDIIDGGYMYSVVYLRNLYEMIGTYICKRDLSTGETIWLTRYGLVDNPRQEIARNMFINQNGNLEVFSQLKPNPLGTEPWWLVGFQNFKHTKRIYDVSDGSLLFYDHPDYNDVGYFVSNFNYFNRSSTFFREDEKWRCIQMFKDSTDNSNNLSSILK